MSFSFFLFQDLIQDAAWHLALNILRYCPNSAGSAAYKWGMDLFCVPFDIKKLKSMAFLNKTEFLSQLEVDMFKDVKTQ